MEDIYYKCELRVENGKNEINNIENNSNIMLI
jgi:hypothetical protein